MNYSLLFAASSVGGAMALLVEGGEKRATTAVPGELDAPTCNYRNRHGGTVVVSYTARMA